MKVKHGAILGIAILTLCLFGLRDRVGGAESYIDSTFSEWKYDPNDAFRQLDGSLCTLTVWGGMKGGTFLTIHPGWQIDIADPNCVSDESVRRLGKSGRLCTVFGHNWRDGSLGESETSSYADYHPYTNYRTCRVCGKCETQHLSWE